MLPYQVVEQEFRKSLIGLRRGNLEVAAIRAEPERSKVFLFGDAVATAGFQLQAEFLAG